MAEKRKKYPVMTSPRGVFKYPKLTTPDYGTDKFPKPDGEYNVRLIVDEQDAQVQKLLKTLEPIMDQAEQEAKAALAEMPVKRRKEIEAKGGLTKNEVYATVYDEETEEPTGEIELRFKMKASGERNDGSRWKARPALFDAKGQPLPVWDAKGNLLPNAVQIWGGTEGRISFRPEPYFVASSGAFGLTLRLEAAQVITLVGPGQRSAAGYGFCEEEGYDAYEHEIEDDAATTSTDAGSEDDDTGADDGNF